MAKAKMGELQEFFKTSLELETNECIVWPYHTVFGYGLIYDNSIKKSVRVHRKALELRVGKAPEGKPFALHGECHNRACFNYRHLRWGNATENAHDRIRDNTILSSQLVRAKLTEIQVINIYHLLRSGVPQMEIAQAYGVAKKTINNINCGHRWSRVTGLPRSKYYGKVRSKPNGQ